MFVACVWPDAIGDNVIVVFACAFSPIHVTVMFGSKRNTRRETRVGDVDVRMESFGLKCRHALRILRMMVGDSDFKFLRSDGGLSSKRVACE